MLLQLMAIAHTASKVRLIMRISDIRKGGDQMSDQEQNLKAGDEATLKPKAGKIGIWSSHNMGVAS